ncbi:hypothetical protein CBF23_003275 [Marinomonas agarivorans]|nr:hypothetical protein CBF23_003275 [Marinomonas agarivorans]
MFDKEAEERFFNMLSCAPELERFFDRKEGMAKIKSIQIELAREREEAELLRFFGSVWFGNSDHFGFDFINAAKHMGERDKKIVRRWLVDPFFP